MWNVNKYQTIWNFEKKINYRCQSAQLFESLIIITILLNKTWRDLWIDKSKKHGNISNVSNIGNQIMCMIVVSIHSTTV